jgi:hypothetical protein
MQTLPTAHIILLITLLHPLSQCLILLLTLLKFPCEFTYLQPCISELEPQLICPLLAPLLLLTDLPLHLGLSLPDLLHQLLCPLLMHPLPSLHLLILRLLLPYRDLKHRDLLLQHRTPLPVQYLRAPLPLCQQQHLQLQLRLQVYLALREGFLSLLLRNL